MRKILHWFGHDWGQWSRPAPAYEDSPYFKQSRTCRYCGFSQSNLA